MLSFLQKIRNKIESAEKSIIILFLILMILFVFFQTLIRFLARIIPLELINNIASSFDWSLKIAYFLFIWVIFLAASLTTSSRKHIAIDILTKTVPIKVKIYLSLFSNIIGILASLMLGLISAKWIHQNNYFIFAGIYKLLNKAGLNLTIENFYDPIKIIDLTFPAWTLDAAILVGFILMLIKFIINLIEDINGIGSGDYSHIEKLMKEEFE